MSLFGALYVGTSGLQTSQEALNIVAHNITNTDTEGYVRQQVSQGTREYNRIDINITGVAQKQNGLGVFVEEVRQVRDRFVDASFREENGRKGFYDASYAAVEEVQEIFGELDGATFYENMTKVWDAIEELVKDPSSEVCQSMFVQYAQSFCESAGNVYKDLADYQMKLNVTVKNDVDKINEYANRIYKLNENIRAIEAGGVENANDYKDQRNQLLDELGKIGKIQYQSDFYGNVLVQFEGHDLVLMDRVNEMEALEDDKGFYVVFWPDSAKSTINNFGEKVYDLDQIKNDKNASVFNFDVPISSTTDTDLGELKAVVLARGDHKGNWTDLLSDSDYSAVEDSIMMNVMAEFDGLVRNTVNAINGVLEQHSNASTGYLLDENGDPLQLFHRKGCVDTQIPEIIKGEDTSEDGSTLYTKTFLDDKCYVSETATGKQLGIYTRNSNGDYISSDASWFSAANITVNQDLLQYPTHLGFMMPDGSVDYETAYDLEKAFQSKDYILNPSLTNPISITEYYSNLIAQCANSGNVYKSLKENQELTVESIEASRQGAIGVSTDEELSNMIKFQNAYNASSRFINVINEMTEHIINTLAT